MQNGSLIRSDLPKQISPQSHFMMLLGSLSVEVPSMGTIGSNARAQAGSGFSIAIGNKVVWIPFGNGAVVFEVEI